MIVVFNLITLTLIAHLFDRCRVRECVYAADYIDRAKSLLKFPALQHDF